jgi:hypothetical protein
MAESLLALGDGRQAAQEAELGLDLNPSSTDARSALRRATSQDQAEPQPAVLIERFRSLASRGKMTKALRVIELPISNSGGKCPDCHSALASYYEESGQPAKAAAERLIALQESADPSASDRLAARQGAHAAKTRLPVPQ